MKQQLIRHGDVLLKPVSIPSDAKEQKRGKDMTIALGEVTGHHHTLYGSMPNAVVMKGFDERLFVEVNEDLCLRHQEHTEVPVAKGSYEIIIERERNPFFDALRRVVD